eukprot:188425-Lingulodinium_polyedra.AAC.1
MIRRGRCNGGAGVAAASPRSLPTTLVGLLARRRPPRRRLTPPHIRGVGVRGERGAGRGAHPSREP